VADLSRATFSNIEYQSLNFVMHSPGRITVHPALIVATEQTVHIELREVGVLLLFQQQILDDALLDADKPRSQGCITKFSDWYSMLEKVALDKSATRCEAHGRYGRSTVTEN